MLKTVEFTGKSVEEAIENAVKGLKMDRDDLSVQVLDIGKKGFLGLGATQAKVSISYEDGTVEAPVVEKKPTPKPQPKPAAKPAVETKPAPKAAQESPRLVKSVAKTEKPAEKVAPKVEKPKAAEPQSRLVKAAPKTDKPAEKPAAKPAPRAEKPVRESRPARPAQEPREMVEEVREYPAPVAMDADKIPEIAKIACIFVEGLMEKMGVNGKAMVLASSEADHIRLDLSGDDMGCIIGRRGDTLDSIQYLTSLVMNKGLEDHVRLTIDTENYRVKRAESLERLARKMAVKVAKYHRPLTLEPMNPYERRVIHSALQDFRGVSTHSTGSDPNRRVVITPEGMQRRSSGNGGGQGGNRRREDGGNRAPMRPNTNKPRTPKPAAPKADVQADVQE